VTTTNSKLDTLNTTVTNKHLNKIQDSVDVSGQSVLVSNMITGFATDSNVTTTNSKLDTLNTTVTNKHLNKIQDSVDVSGQSVLVSNMINGFALDSNVTTTNSKLDTLNTTVTNKHLNKSQDSVDVSGQSVLVSNMITGFATSSLQTTANNLLTDIKTKNLDSNTDSVMVWAGNDDFKIRNLSATVDNVDVGLSTYSYTNRNPPFPASRDVLSSQLVGVNNLAGDELVNLIANSDGHLKVDISGQRVQTDISGQNVKVSNMVDVSGKFWQDTQPVSGTLNVNTITGFALDSSVTTTNTKLDTLNTTVSNKHLSRTTDSVDISGQRVVCDISGQRVDISGQRVIIDISGQRVDVSGQIVNSHSMTQDGAGNDITSKLISSSRSLDVNIINNSDPIIIDFVNPTLNIAGAVTVSNFPTVQGISGDVNITNTSLAVTGSVNANITNTSLPVTGSFYQATQPVSLASNVGIKDSSGNSIKVDASNNLLVNVAAGSLTVSSMNIKDSSGNSIKADASGNLNVSMQAYNRTNAVTSNLTTVQPVGASSSVKALETYSYIVGLDNGSNLPLQLTSTQGTYQNSLDTYINNGSTTNFNFGTGLNVYQILPKTKTYTFGGYDSNATASGLIIGNATAGKDISSNSFNFGGSMTFYALLGATGTKNITFDYVDSNGDFATSASIAINGTTATSLGTFRCILDFRLNSSIVSGEALYIGTSSNVTTLRQTSLYSEDINQKLIGAITIPNGYIGYITNLTSLVATATGLQLNRWNTAGVRSAVWRINNTGNIYINSGHEGTLGGVFTAGDTLVYSAQSAVTGKSIIANLVLKSIS
jgi:hypothetical protein